MAHITQIWIFPIKSCRGISLQKTSVEARGLAWDRRWVLADEHGVFLTQRTLRSLGDFQPRLDVQGIWVNYLPTGEEVLIPWQPETKDHVSIQIWEDHVECFRVNAKLDDWFSEKLGQKVGLFFQPEESIRLIEPDYQVTGKEHTSLSDGYPILLVSEASIEKISLEAGQRMDVLRFRPNIVVGGLEPFEEDQIQTFTLGDAVLACVKPCARCVLTTVDPVTLEVGPEPLKSLAHYRKKGHKILVGQNTLVKGEGIIQVGDRLERV